MEEAFQMLGAGSLSLPTLSLFGHSMRVLRHDPINAQTKLTDPGNGSIIDFVGVHGLPTLVTAFATDFTLHLACHGKYCECGCIAFERRSETDDS